MAHDVFISYSSLDKPVGDAVCSTLEARGIRCWIAPRDIVPGKDWGEAIVEAITAARVMVLVFSANANHSAQVTREVERAVSRGLIIIPFRIEDVVPERSLEYFLGTPHWLDALTPPLEQHLAYLADTVHGFLVGEPPASRPTTPPRRTVSPRVLGVIAASIIAVIAIIAFARGGGGSTVTTTTSPAPGTTLSGSSGSGGADRRLAGSWVIQNAPNGLSKWDASFRTDGTYNATITFDEQGTMFLYGEPPAAPLQPDASGGSQQIILTPSNGSPRGLTWNAVPAGASGDPQGKVTASGTLPVGFEQFVGSSGADVTGTFLALPWQVVNGQHWKTTFKTGGVDWAADFQATNGSYTFHAQHSESGRFEAAGEHIRTVSDSGVILDGIYAVLADGRLTVTPIQGQSKGQAIVWTKAAA